MKLYAYQSEYLKDLSKNIIISCDTGLGKGQISLENYRKHSYMKPLLIIAPASKVRTGDWDREVVMAFGKRTPPYEVVSYDNFARNPAKYQKPDMVVIMDEAHYICNSQSKRGKAVARLIASSASQFMGLTATPLPNGWRSLENYAIIFGLVKNKTTFVNRYVRIDRTRGFPIILGYNYTNELESFWNKVSKPLKRDGIAELPESKSLPVLIELKDKNLAAYKKVIKTKLTANGEMLDSPSKLFAYLRQWGTNYREDSLASILDGTSEHVVIFYNFNAERDMILSLLERKFNDRTIYEQNGHVSKLPKRSKWDKMPHSVTLAQYQSASTAIELTYASVTVFLSPTYSWATFHQAMGRTKRNGQAKKTLFYMIAIKGTIDEEIYYVLKFKRDFDNRLFENYIKAIDKNSQRR